MKVPYFILVTSAAGYIGSHVMPALLDAGWPMVVIGDPSTEKRPNS